MTDLSLSAHAEARMRQRGLRPGDLACVVALGRAIEGGAFLLAAAEADGEIARLKRQIGRLERLRGAKVVLSGDLVLTAYVPSRAGQRRALRRGREMGA